MTFSCRLTVAEEPNRTPREHAASLVGPAGLYGAE
jgi:hypothetical protein